MNIPTKEILKFTYCTVNNSINEKIIELLLCFQYGKSLTKNELSFSKRRKLSLLYKEYTYTKELIKRDTINLSEVCQEGYETILKCLLEHGVDVQGNEYTLTVACRRGYNNIVKYLVEHGADVQRNKETLTEACRNGHEAVEKYLVEHGKYVQGNEDALTEACEDGHEKIVEYFVEHGADVQHALTIACCYRHETIVKY